MIGVFDSGVGGLASLAELRRLCPLADICFYADNAHAPYGTRSGSELSALVKRDIDILRSYGAERILAACCTASAVMLGEDKTSADVTEIITPTVTEALRISRGGRIGYISTAFTKNSFEFENRLMEADGGVRVYGVIAAELVCMAQSGERDGDISDGSLSVIERILEPLRRQRVDTVILGCTHFAYFEKTVSYILGCPAVSSARVGAECMAKSGIPEGTGRTVYID